VELLRPRLGIDLLIDQPLIPPNIITSSELRSTYLMHYAPTPTQLFFSLHPFSDPDEPPESTTQACFRLCNFLGCWAIGSTSTTAAGAAPPTDGPHSPAQTSRHIHQSSFNLSVRSRRQAAPFASGPTYLPPISSLILLLTILVLRGAYVSIDSPSSRTWTGRLLAFFCSAYPKLHFEYRKP
jgi:hypothetical protein